MIYAILGFVIGFILSVGLLVLAILFQEKPIKKEQLNKYKITKEQISEEIEKVSKI